MSCIYKTADGYCELHSDGIEYKEPCVEGPCDDEATEMKTEPPLGVAPHWIVYPQRIAALKEVE